MLAKWIKRILAIVAVVVVVAAVVYALMPAPIGIDVAVIGRGPLEVTVDEEGIAQIRDVYRVSAPIAGKLNRIPVRVGDAVSRERVPVALIQPVEPSLLDVRTQRELQATAGAARAAVGLAEAQVTSAEASERLANSDLDRARRLAESGAVSARALEKAVTDVDTAHAAVEQAKANLALRQSELASAEAHLIQPGTSGAEGGSAHCCVPVTSPIDGVVLKRLVESEQVVAAGTPLIEIGDPKDMEVVVHLLSSDAVEIKGGAPATLTDWGGAGALNAYVRRIDPAAYTKVSALGVEEQRVDATLDIADPYDKWEGLGHEYRVMAHIRTWKGGDVVKVAVGALFRRGADWNVFRVVDGKAVLTSVLLGHRNTHDAEVLGGLQAGDTVVLHPSDQVKDGASVAPRPDEGGQD
jgi:HlyD family secretion protein